MTALLSAPLLLYSKSGLEIYPSAFYARLPNLTQLSKIKDLGHAMCTCTHGLPVHKQAFCMCISLIPKVCLYAFVVKVWTESDPPSLQLHSIKQTSICLHFSDGMVDL
eukprot:scaffold23341_cov18-Tisochrysis_lutea.AAC.1